MIFIYKNPFIILYSNIQQSFIIRFFFLFFLSWLVEFPFFKTTCLHNFQCRKKKRKSFNITSETNLNYIYFYLLCRIYTIIDIASYRVCRHFLWLTQNTIAKKTRSKNKIKRLNILVKVLFLYLYKLIFKNKKSFYIINYYYLFYSWKKDFIANPPTILYNTDTLIKNSFFSFVHWGKNYGTI